MKIRNTIRVRILIHSWIFYLLLLFITISSTVCAQRMMSKKDFICSFPFRVLEGGVIIFKATIDDHPDSLTFILDTGNGGISLDSTTVSYLGLSVQTSDRILRGIGSMKKLSYTYDRTLKFPGLSTEHLDFHINDYELLTGANGLKIDGIVGYSLLKKYIVHIDFDNQLFEFYRKGKVKYPRSGVFIKRAISGIPIFNAGIEDENKCNANFYFDTGAGLCLLLSDKFENDSSIFKEGKKVIYTQAEGIGKQKMRLTTVKKVRIGHYTFKKVPTHTFFDENNVTNYPSTGGLIGNDILRRFNIILNYGDSIIHLNPNDHFFDPFDYSYTGLSLYAINGKVMVDEVMEESPSSKAGFMLGDIIVAINNNFSGNIQVYKSIIQLVNTKAKIIVNRGGELLTLYLPVESILQKN